MVSVTERNKPRNNAGARTALRTLLRQRQLMLMSVPMLLYVLLFNYAPLWGWITAFMDYKPSRALFDNPWVGFANFEWLFHQPEFYLAIRNTMAMSAINLVFGTASSIVLALFLNEIRFTPFKRTVQTVTYLPHFLSWVIVVGLAQSMFATDGVVNHALMALHVIQKPAFWLGEGRYFWWLVGVINVWKEVGWNSIIYLAAIASIDPTLYEAASIDGAGRFRKMISVTLPGVRATFFVLLIMNIGHLMEAGFEIQYLMGQNLLVDWSQTIDIYVLKYGITQGRYARATAAGIFKSVVSIVLLYGANRIAKRMDETTLM
ncbi:MAG: ABC transporter permease subunit [Oscillospiraceae bacterium]|jgi:putative aldouronate transport system permease protein|nr:ABC transporter permease subunit [Oscillospiraceae bacterium]